MPCSAEAKRAGRNSIYESGPATMSTPWFPDELLLHAFGHAAYHHADYEAASLAAFGAERACRRLTIFCSALSRIEQVFEQHRVGIVDLSEIVYPAILHDCGHDFAIGHVHLAAIRFLYIMFGGGGSFCFEIFVPLHKIDYFVQNYKKTWIPTYFLHSLL